MNLKKLFRRRKTPVSTNRPPSLHSEGTITIKKTKENEDQNPEPAADDTQDRDVRSKSHQATENPGTRSGGTDRPGGEPRGFGRGLLMPEEKEAPDNLPDDGIPVFNGLKRRLACDDIFSLARNA